MKKVYRFIVFIAIAFIFIAAASRAQDKPFEGVTVTVGVFANGPRGVISGPLYYWRDAWEKRTGAKLKIVEIPFGQLYEKIFTDLRTGAGFYDAFIGPSWYYGDYIEGGYILPVDGFMRESRFPKWDPEAVVPPIRKLLTWGGKYYGVVNDCDAMIFYYRRDAFRNPGCRSKFKERFGYALPDPPRTWEQVRDLAEFFDGRNINEGKPWDDGQPGSGICMHLKRGSQGFFHFMAFSAPYAVMPGKPDRYRGVYWFDPETFEPLIDKPGHVRALARMIELSKFGPKAQLAWSLGEAWDLFLKGKAAMIFSWGDVGSLAQDPERSNIQGLLGCAALPGTMEVWDLEQKKFVKLDSPNMVANTVGASWHGVISKYSKHPDAVYDLLAFQASRDVNYFNVTHGWTGINPGISYHWLPPEGQASVMSYTKAGWNAADVEQYVRAYYENYHLTKSSLEYLRIPGTPEYWDALDVHVSEAMVGRASPAEALKRTAKDWRAIAKRRGLDEQKRLYREAIGYTPR